MALVLWRHRLDAVARIDRVAAGACGLAAGKLEGGRVPGRAAGARLGQVPGDATISRAP